MHNIDKTTIKLYSLSSFSDLFISSAAKTCLGNVVIRLYGTLSSVLLARINRFTSMSV